MHFTKRHKRWGLTKHQQWNWSPALKISWKVENLQKIDFQIIVSGVPQSVQKWFWTHLCIHKCPTIDLKIKKRELKIFVRDIFTHYQRRSSIFAPVFAQWPRLRTLATSCCWKWKRDHIFCSKFLCRLSKVCTFGKIKRVYPKNPTY